MSERTFEDVISEWTNTLLEMNKSASIPEALLILKLGPLGQKLIYEAALVGGRNMAKVAREVING
jgi:hypothetical protein